MAAPPASFNSLALEIITEIWADLPRQAKSNILAVSRTWNQQARAIHYMWTNILFGEGSSIEDLTVARTWIEYSGNLKLVAIVLRPPADENSDGLTVSILGVLAPVRQRLRHLHIYGADTDVNSVQTFMMTGTFSSLQFLDITLSRHWLSIIRDHPSPYSTLEIRPAIFHALDIPLLSAMHISNIPPFWPSLLPTCNSLTEIVLGPPMQGFDPSLMQLKQALESATSLTRLGFYETAPLIPESVAAADFSITLSAVTALSLRLVRPGALRDLMAILRVPNFCSLTIALEESHGADDESNTLLLIQQLHNPDFAIRLHTLNLQSLSYECDLAFFQPFSNLRSLGLDFSFGCLKDGFWHALIDPATGTARYPPNLNQLTLVDIFPVHAQELLHARAQLDLPRLEHLSLVMRPHEAKNARTPRWSAWLRKNLDSFEIQEYANKKRYDSLRGAFKV